MDVREDELSMLVRRRTYKGGRSILKGEHVIYKGGHVIYKEGRSIYKGVDTESGGAPRRWTACSSTAGCASRLSCP